ncbi:MAG TPA: nuclear transport factor 2 family protein [Candidatus Acidoferrales bacterium]|nr:nuclear transport factor 2 family protein [Candidatus Acidoferrales bacterium]
MDLEQQVEELSRRLQAVEDELAIHKLITRYGLAVDIGDADRTAEVFAEDGIYDADVRLMNGREDVRDMVRSQRHQDMVGRCAHQIGPAVVKVDGDRGVAVGYSRVYLRDPQGIGIYRVSYNHWTLRRRESQWLITHRRTRLLGHEEAAAIFRAGLEELTPQR